MKIVILHNEPRPDAAADEADVLVQAAAVESALRSRGHAVERLGCGLDLAAVAAGLRAGSPDLVFNLVEGLAGHDRLVAVVPSLLEALGVPFTGCPADAIHVTGNKLLAKERLVGAGLPTPAMPARCTRDGGTVGAALASPAAAFTAGRYILKPVWEHGSLGMEDGAVAHASSPEELGERLAAFAARTGRDCFAEAFVDGRELNLSLLAGGAGESPVEVLPAAEIDFSGFPPGKPRIVGWAAKWDERSFEYQHTLRRFPADAADWPLLAELARLARACWDLFGLADYARVDFRVDDAGRPFILEVNANPCLAPDAGFAAAAAEAGIGFDATIDRIVRAAGARYPWRP